MSQNQHLFNIIGLMSGTSLDGLDIAHCQFQYQNEKWHYKILEAETISYPSSIQNQLQRSIYLSGLELAQLNVDLGIYFGTKVNEFVSKKRIDVDFIASHGHTIFHQPDSGLTVQIGAGSNIAAKSNLPVVCDFRTNDVAYDGQGAPLVPIGDQHLFSDFEYCINLGGFANTSFEQNDRRIAYDICPVNIILNHLSEKLGLRFDDNGEIAKSGTLIPSLLSKLNSLEYYSVSPPKSLGKEWVEMNIQPLLKSEYSTKDLLRTFCEHIALQISNSLQQEGQVLVTGGGAFNNFLINRIIELSPNNEFIIPDKKTINFKEALIFAFLGLLRWNGIPNCLSSVTGATKDCIGGAIYLP